MHIPVLEEEVLKYLAPKPNENFIDCTIGQGGHASAILERNGPKGMVLGIDRDKDVIENTKKRKRLILACDNFANLREIVKREKFNKVQGILFDLGMSSWHLEESGRGFTFQKREPLDMRYDRENPLTAQKIVNFYSKIELEKILKEYGEEQFFEKIAEAIIAERRMGPIETTYQLAEIIKKAVPGWYCRQKLHFATKTFQALRIAVNNELDGVSRALPQSLEVLERGGRLAVISFHSLEDRIVKNFLKESARENEEGRQAKEGLPAEENGGASGSIIKILTKKPITPSDEEVRKNPRSRSARLRAAIKL